MPLLKSLEADNPDINLLCINILRAAMLNEYSSIEEDYEKVKAGMQELGFDQQYNLFKDNSSIAIKPLALEDKATINYQQTSRSVTFKVMAKPIN